MGKTNFRRMMMLRDHDRDREPERDRLEEERDRREREMERRLRKLEGGNDRYPYYPQEENRYIDPYPIPRYPDVEYGRKMPQIGFSQNGDWDKRSGRYERGSADSRSIRMPRQHLTHDEAEEWCDSMVNADGTKGCHWTLEQTQDVAKQRNINCDPNDFWSQSVSPLTLRASTLTWQRRSLRTRMPQTARHISTGIALLISKRKRESVFRRPPLIILTTDYPKSIWSLDAATDRL